MRTKPRSFEETRERIDRALRDVWSALDAGDVRARDRAARRYLDANRELAKLPIYVQAAVDNEHEWLVAMWEWFAIDEESPPPQVIADFIERLGRRVEDVLYRAADKRRGTASRASGSTAASAAEDSR